MHVAVARIEAAEAQASRAGRVLRLSDAVRAALVDIVCDDDPAAARVYALAKELPPAEAKLLILDAMTGDGPERLDAIQVRFLFLVLDLVEA